MAVNRPKLEIVEEPCAAGHRFRYSSEKSTHAGILYGERSRKNEPSYPTIKVHTNGYQGYIIVNASLVCKNEPHYVHPHELTGQNCSNGYFYLMESVNQSVEIKFKDVSVQRTKKNEIWEKLRQRVSLCDPYSLGLPDKKCIDMGCCRLCFELWIFSGVDPEVCDVKVSRPMYDERNNPKLQIQEFSHYSGSVEGGLRVMMFTSEVRKDDLQIIIAQLADGVEVWHAVVAEFNVHKQCGISFCMPPYTGPNQNSQSEIPVIIQLKRPTDGATSDPVDFVYVSSDIFVVENKRKRKRVDNTLMLERAPSQGATFTVPDETIEQFNIPDVMATPAEGNMALLAEGGVEGPVISLPDELPGNFNSTEFDSFVKFLEGGT